MWWPVVASQRALSLTASCCVSLSSSTLNTAIEFRRSAVRDALVTHVAHVVPVLWTARHCTSSTHDQAYHALAGVVMARRTVNATQTLQDLVHRPAIAHLLHLGQSGAVTISHCRVGCSGNVWKRRWRTPPNGVEALPDWSRSRSMLNAPQKHEIHHALNSSGRSIVEMARNGGIIAISPHQGHYGAVKR